MIEHYQIIWGDSSSDLAGKVNKEIRFGWQPIGGVCHHQFIAKIAPSLGEQRVLMQAMVQYKIKLNEKPSETTK